ncbi:hypothetical protein ABPG74_018742 [Tetrahymena malaccensis]
MNGHSLTRKPSSVIISTSTNSKAGDQKYLIKKLFQTKASNEKYQREIELLNGETVSYKNFIITITRNYFERFGNLLMFCFYIIFIVSPYYSIESSYVSLEYQEYNYFFLVSIILSFLGQLTMELYFDQRRWRHSQYLNNQEVQILKRFDDQTSFEQDAKQNSHISIYKTVKAKDVEIGDILFIRKNEILAADVILLEMSDSSCCLNSSFNEGLTTQKKAIPPSITYISKSSKIKGLHFDYKKILNGIIEYVSAEVRDKTKFEGFMKLSKDPQGIIITSQNIGYRGSVLEYADWALGIVIYCGHDCYYYKKDKQKTLKKPSFFSKKSGKLFAISIFFYLFAAFVSVINYFTNSCYPDLPQLDSNGQQFRNKSTGRIGMSYMYDYVLFLPQFYYFINDLKTLIFAILQNNYYEKNKNQQEENEEKQEIDKQVKEIKEEDEESLTNKQSEKSEIQQKVDCIIKENAESSYDKPISPTNNIPQIEKIPSLKNIKENSQFIKNKSNDNSSKKPYIYSINSSKPLADLTLTTHCFLDKTGTLTQGRSFMVHKLYLEDCSYFISENYIDPLFKSVNGQNVHSAKNIQADNKLSNENDRQIENLLGFKIQPSQKNEVQPSIFINNQNSHRNSILNTNGTQYTAMNTENQNDIVGEEGIFLRQKLPQNRQNKKKTDLEAIGHYELQSSSQKNLFQKSPSRSRHSFQIDTKNIIAREQFNFVFNEEECQNEMNTPNHLSVKKSSQQSIKSSNQIKSQAHIQTNSQTEVKQNIKKVRKISFAQNLPLTIDTNLNSAENNSGSFKYLKQPDIQIDLFDQDKVSNQNNSFQHISSPHSRQSPNTDLNKDIMNIFKTNPQNYDTISETSYASSRIKQNNNNNNNNILQSPQTSNNSLLNRFRKVTMEILQTSCNTDKSDYFTNSKLGGLFTSNDSISPLRKINKRYAIDNIIPQKDEQRLYEEIRSDHVKFIPQREAIIAFTICHVSKSVLHDEISQLITDHQSIYDELFIEFSKRFDCKLKCIAKGINHLEYIFKLNKETHIYQVVVPPVYNQRGTRLAILVRIYNHYFLYTREELVNVPFYLKSIRNLKERMEKHLKYMIENGQVGVLFCKKQLTEQQANLIIEKYINIEKGLNFLEKEKQIETLYRDQLSNMDMVTLVSLKENLNPNAKSLVENLRQANINTWLLTGDDYQRALATSYETGMLQKFSKNDIFHFQSETEEDTINLMKQNLKTIRELLDSDRTDQKATSISRKYQNTTLQRVYNRMLSYQNQNLKISNMSQSKGVNHQKNPNAVSVCVIVNGQCLDKILKNQYLKDHFSFICFFCESLIGYSLKPSQKAELVSLVKNVKTDATFTLAIGDGLNDLQMMQRADFSIQYQNQNLKSVQFEHGLAQITVSQLSAISKLIFSQSRHEAELFEETLFFTFYRSFFIFFIVFFWNFMSCSYGDIVLSFLDLILIHFVSLFFQSVLYYLRKYQKLYENKYDSFTVIQQYFHNKFYFSDVFKKFLLQLIPQSFIDAFILFILTYQMKSTPMELNGQQIEKEQLILMTVLIFYFLVHIKVMIILNQSRKTFIANIAFPFIILCIYMGIYYETQDVSFYFSHLTILLIAAIVFNFIITNFFFRTFIPLIQEEMMRDAKLFKKIFQQIENQYKRILQTLPVNIFSKQQQQFLSESQCLQNEKNEMNHSQSNSYQINKDHNNNQNMFQFNKLNNNGCFNENKDNIIKEQQQSDQESQKKNYTKDQTIGIQLFNKANNIISEQIQYQNPNNLKNKVIKQNANKYIEKLGTDDNEYDNLQNKTLFRNRQISITNNLNLKEQQSNKSEERPNTNNNTSNISGGNNQNEQNIPSNPSTDRKIAKPQQQQIQDNINKNKVEARRNMKFKGYTFDQIFKMVFKDNEIDTILQDLNTENVSVISSKIDKIFLHFPSKEIELKFAQSIIQSWFRFYRISTIILSLICELALSQIMNYIYQDQFGFNLYSVSFGLFLLTWGFMFTPYYTRFFFKVNQIILTIRILTRLTYIIFDSGHPFDNLQTMFYCQILQYSVKITPPVFFSLQFAVSISFCLKFLIIYDEYQLSNSDDNYLKLYLIFTTFICILAFQILCFYKKYEYDVIERKNFQRINKISVETKKINNVLSILLPKFILDSIDEKGRELQEDQGDVAILFCDICDFDLIIQEEQSNIIKLLDKLFRFYDDACSINGIQKIETVGKTYMAAAGIKGIKYDESQKKYNFFHPVIRCILMSNQMFEASKKITYGKQQQKIKIKIGIHYGPVLAGVIGGHKPQFSLIGDTVNMASRVCSTGEANFITLSDQAKESCQFELQLLNEKKFQQQNGFQIVLFERTVNAKGKGNIKTYQVTFKKYKKKEIHLLRKFSEKLLQQRNSVLVINNDNSNGDSYSSPYYNLGSPNKKNYSIFSPEATHGGTSIAALDYSRQGEIKEETEINSSNIVSQFNNSSKSKENIYIEEQVYNNKYIYGNHPRDLQDIQEIRSNSVSSNAQSIFEANQKQLAYIKIIKDLVEEIQIIPQLEHAPILKDQELDIEKVRSHFQELKNEAISLTNQQHKINSKVNIQDIIFGKYNIDLQLFYDTELQKSYQIVKSKNAFLCGFEVFKMLVANLMRNYLSNEGVYITFFMHMASALLLLSTIFGINYITRIGLKYLKFIIFIIYSTVITSIVFEGYLNIKYFPNRQLINLQTAAVIIIFYVFLSFKFFTIHEKTFISFCLILNYYMFTYVNNIFEWEYCYLTSVIILNILYRSFMQLELDFSSYLHTKSLDQKMNDQNKLLEYLLPRHIRDQFLENSSKQINLIDKFDQVTILYADIAGFTKYSASVQPEQVFFMLRELFTKFDQKCQENNVYKLYTIGDCYVVMGLVNLNDRNTVKEAMNVIGMGFEMIEIIKQVRSIVNFDELDMRIGIHTGSIIGGVVGTGVVRYDIYGPDVVIANKMESNGESGRVMISEATYNLVHESSTGVYEFEREQEVQISSSKKSVKAYFVKRPTDNEFDQFSSQNDSNFNVYQNRTQQFQI